jgi:hypothetical protein
MRVQNMTSNRSGRAVANQFEIFTDNDGKYFQSYNTVIARIFKGKRGKCKSYVNKSCISAEHSK